MRGEHPDHPHHRLVLRIETCYTCGVPFGIPTELQYSLVQNRRAFYCPNGHSQSYVGKTDQERLAEAQERIAREQTRTRQVRDQLAATERSNVALRGVVTKKRKVLARVKNGVCPCCNRSFAHVYSAHVQQAPRLHALKFESVEQARRGVAGPAG